MKLFPYQIEGAKFLAAKGRALLADEPGLGKSAQAIAACDALGVRSVCVVCPASVVENWKREVARFRTKQWDFVVLSYNRAASAEAIANPFTAFDVLILDEAHYLKNPKAKRTKAIFGPKCDGAGGLVERAKHVFLLTGTPTPNHAAELWPMLRAVTPAAITPKDKPLSWAFVNRYCKTRDNGFGIQIVGNKNAAALREAIAPYVLRRKKEEVLADLPPIRFDELPLRVEAKAWESLPGGATLAELELIEKALDEHGAAGLREIAPHVAQLRRLTGLAKVAPVIEWIEEQFEGGLKKLVVFAHHREVIDRVHASLLNATRHAVKIDGGMDAESRQGAVDEFQINPNCCALIGQIQAAGTGITLTAASDLLFVESSWVPAENEQAAMRIHRIGQRNACLVRFATLAGSIDERIQRAVMRKTQDIAKLFS